jgi:hypothetical protein
MDLTTGYGLDDRGSIFSRGKRFFSIPQFPDRLSDPPRFLYISYTEAFSMRVKLPKNETDHSHPSSEEVKNIDAIPPLPIRLHGVVLN